MRRIVDKLRAKMPEADEGLLTGVALIIMEEAKKRAEKVVEALEEFENEEGPCQS